MEYLQLSERARSTVEFLKLRRFITKNYRSIFREELEDWESGKEFRKESEDINNINSIID